MKILGILFVIVAAIVATALFLRRNKKIAAQVDAVATQASTTISNDIKKL